jgi:ribosomal protein L7/L12
VDEELKRQITDILRRDGALPALSALREKTGMGIREAKAFIDALVVPPSPVEEPPDTVEMDDAFRQEVGVILRRDGKVAAIKAIRTRTGMSLEEAKVALLSLTPPTKFFGLPGNLLDHAARFVLGSPTPDERKRIDEQAVKSWGENSWAAGVRRARDLAEQSYDLCDRSRNGEFSSEEVRDRLRRLCPGFSDEIYGLAYDRGMLASR